MKLFNFKKLLRNKSEKPERVKMKKEKKIKPEIATPKKRHPAVAGLLYALRVLWGAVKLVLIILILCGFIVGGLGAGLIYGYIVTTPELSASDLQLTKFNTFIYDIDGNVVAELKRNENRVWIDYVDIPKNLINAYVAVEDKRFWEHKGVDFRRFLYATYYSATSYLKGSESLQGGSTITQQMVKNLTGSDDITIKRKIQEMWQALKLEREGLSKEDILTRYLNTIPFGGTIYGIEIAAQAYYGKDVRDLTLAECASLAGITQWPSKYIPSSEENIENNLERTHMILGLMLEQGMITQAEYEQAVQENINFVYNPSAGKATKTSTQSYFVDEVVKAVIRDLSEQKGISSQTAEDMIYNSGLKIYTTMDPKVQKALDEVFTDDSFFPAVNEEAKRREEIPQAAMVVVDPETGAVRGLYGGYGEKKGSVFNRATQMKRSPGSSIKPILVYAPGIETGRLTAGTVIDDVPQHMLLNDVSVPEKERTRLYPKNVDNKNYGLTTVRNAITHSRNVISALALRDYTSFKVGLNYLEKVGLPRWEDEGKISIAMGGFTSQMSPLEMASAYTVFAYKGVYWEPYFYTSVEDVNGNVILEKRPKGTKVYSEQTAFIMNNMLMDVVTDGTATDTAIKNKKGEDIPTAGKTGTSDNYVDRWFCGMTPYYVASTWYGYDNRQVPISLISAESANARKIWHAVMTKIHEELEPVEFFSTIPPKIVKREICMDSGKLPTDLCRHDPRGSRVIEEYFIEGTEPEYGDTCNIHFKAKICTSSKDEHGRPVLAHEDCPPETVQERIFIRRPVEYKPALPTDPYPEDWIYGIYEGEYCPVHDSSSANNSKTNTGTYSPYYYYYNYQP